MNELWTTDHCAPVYMLRIFEHICTVGNSLGELILLPGKNNFGLLTLVLPSLPKFFFFFSLSYVVHILFMNIKDSLVLFLLLPLAFCFPLSSSTLDAISEGTSLSVEKPEEVLISPNGIFSAGFYSVGDNAFYVL
jgi:hypothetical protein